MVIANVSHEMRTPLQGAIGLTELLLGTPIQPDQHEYVEVLRSCAVSLLAVVDDVLNYAQLDAQRLQLVVIDFDLRQTVESIIQLLAPQAHSKGLELAMLFQHDVPDVVAGDPGRLRQILTNLLGNAIEYTDQGEIVLTVRVVDHAAGNAVIRFEVRDTGPGITPDHQAHLFEPFYQVDS